MKGTWGKTRRFLAVLLAVLWIAGILPTGGAQAVQGGKLIAVTFDDGPGPYTERLLDGLKARGVKVTFFMLGSCARNYPSTVARAYREGHQIANHSYDHPQLTTLSYAGVQNQIQTTSAILARSGASNFMVRAPYGATNSTVRSAVGAPLIVWSVDPVDWKYRNAATVRSNIVRSAFDGAVVLVHDIHSTSVDGALAAIDDLKARGYEFVTVRELFRRRGVALKNGQEYYSCKPNGTDLGPVPAPVISQETVNGKIQIRITAAVGAAIYCTSDGSDPVTAGHRYADPFTVSGPCTIRAVAAYDLNGSRSEEVSLAVTKPVANPPDLRVEGGVLTLENRTPGAEIQYTLDGSAVTPESPVYTAPVPLEPGTVIHAVAGGGEFLPSPAAEGYYSARGNFFRDLLPGRWYSETIDRAVSEGLLAGVGGDRYAPAEPLSRAELVTLLYSLAGKPEPNETIPPFADVPAGKYYSSPVTWAAEAGIVHGVDAERFEPLRTLTRQELAVIVAHYLDARGVPLSEGDAAVFTDGEEIAEWAEQAVARVSGLGLMIGDDAGRFDPQGSCTRAQAVSVLLGVADLPG